MRQTLTGAALAFLLAACTTDGVSRPPPTAPFTAVGQQHTGYIVQLQPHANPNEVAASVGAAPRFVYVNALKGFAASLPAAAIEALQRNPLVHRIELVQPVTTTAVSSWGLDRIDERNLPLDGIYAAPSTGSGVRVYIIDSGIRYSHADFQGRAIFGTDFVGDGLQGGDCRGHGTHVAGTVGGAQYGVANAVTLVSVRVFGCTGGTDNATVIAAVDWVTGNRILPAVANMSLVGGFSQITNDAVSNSIASGVVYAIAAGNNNFNACSFSPASTPNAITVGATDISDVRASYSNFGTCVDLFAPGSAITSAWINDDQSSNIVSGTSMASPHVAGAAALVLAAQPSLTPAQVGAAITGNATAGVLTNVGTGSPNLLLFVGAGSGEPPPPPPPGPAVHVGDIDVSMTLRGSSRGRDQYSYTLGIVVHDDQHQPVSGAVIRFETGNGLIASCTTGSTGRCSGFGTVSVKKNQRTFSVTVLSVSGSYLPSANHDPDGDSNGTQIVVVLP